MGCRASPGRPGGVLCRVDPRERRAATILSPSLDREAGGGVSFAGSARSDPRTWNGRPDGSGEAALPHWPGRGCHCERGSTLTSWRRGRMGRSGLRAGLWCHRVGCRRRSERRVGAVAWQQGRSDPSNSHTATASQSQHAWPSHADFGDARLSSRASCGFRMTEARFRRLKHWWRV